MATRRGYPAGLRAECRIDHPFATNSHQQALEITGAPTTRRRPSRSVGGIARVEAHGARPDFPPKRVAVCKVLHAMCTASATDVGLLAMFDCGNRQRPPTRECHLQPVEGTYVADDICPMVKKPEPVAASLGVRERMLLFCVASGTDWQRAGVTGETVTALVVRGLIVRDGRGRLVLTDDGRAALRALLPGL